MAKKVLIVGGGCVGRVYGWSLNQPNIELSFYLKAKHAKDAKNGFTLYNLNRDREKRSPIKLKNFRVLTRPEELEAEAWDQIYLTVSSTAIRSGWLKDFAPATSRARAIVSLQPGIEDRKYLLQFFPDDKLISGAISVIAYDTPLPESREKISTPGTAFYFPPFSPSFMSGPEALVREAASMLTAGGMKAKYTKINVIQKMAFPSALLITFISALESAQWSFSQLKKPSQLKRLTCALQETTHIVSHRFQISRPFTLKLISPFTLKFVLDAAPQLLPFELQPYLKKHFMKVGDQTRLMMKDFIDFGKKQGLPVETINQLESENSKTKSN